MLFRLIEIGNRQLVDVTTVHSTTDMQGTVLYPLNPTPQTYIYIQALFAQQQLNVKYPSH